MCVCVLRHPICVKAGVTSPHHLLAGPVPLLHGSQLPWQAALGGCAGVCGGRQPRLQRQSGCWCCKCRLLFGIIFFCLCQVWLCKKRDIVYLKCKADSPVSTYARQKHLVCTFQIVALSKGGCNVNQIILNASIQHQPVLSLLFLSLPLLPLSLHVLVIYVSYLCCHHPCWCDFTVCVCISIQLGGVDHVIGRCF